MLNAPELIELRRANPISLADARRLADELDLHSRVLGLPAEPLTSGPGCGARRRALVTVLAAAALVAAIVAATPAWALVRQVLPFWNQPTAPQSVQVQVVVMTATIRCAYQVRDQCDRVPPPSGFHVLPLEPSVA